MSLYVVEPKFLLMILMFANAEEAVWNQQQVIDANAPKKSIGELFCTKTKGILVVRMCLLLRLSHDTNCWPIHVLHVAHHCVRDLNHISVAS